MRRLLILMPVLLCFVGCTDGLYYQTRYIPTDVDYYAMELPAAPPDLEGEHAARAECVHPYQKFKTIGKVAYKTDDIHSNGGADGPVIGTTDQRMRLNGPDRALSGIKIMAYSNSPYIPGITQNAFPQLVNGKDTRPRSTTGAGTDVTATPTTVNGGTHSRNYDPYCCGDTPSEGTTNSYRDISSGR